MGTNIKLELNNEIDNLKDLQEKVKKSEIRIEELKRAEHSSSSKKEENFITM